MSYEWMKNSVGLAVHWTSRSARVDGTRLPYAEAVEAFDADRFVPSVVQSGADHCLFTLTHADQYLAFPNEPLKKLLPGRTTRRDLIGEIADGLTGAGVKFMTSHEKSR